MRTWSTRKGAPLHRSGVAAAILCLSACLNPIPARSQLDAADATLPPATEVRARTGASSHPAAAWDAYARALDSARAGDEGAAVVQLRTCLRLDPGNLAAWIGLARIGARQSLSLVSEGIAAAIEAIEQRYDTQRMVLGFVLPGVLLALALTACLTLAGMGIRFVPLLHHGLTEACAGVFGTRRAGWAGAALLVVPVLLPWGMAAASCALVGFAWTHLGKRDRRAAVVALCAIAVAPHLWSILGIYTVPPGRSDLPAVIDRVQRDVPTPALAERIEAIRSAEPGPGAAFAAGILERRLGRMQEAEEAFTEAAASSGPMGAHAVVNLGNLHFWRGDIMGAARRYETKLDDPEARLEARYNLALSLARLHRFEEADQRLAEASRLDFDRVREEARKATDRASGDVMDGMLTPEQLWDLHRHGGGLRSATEPDEAAADRAALQGDRDPVGPKSPSPPRWLFPSTAGSPLLLALALVLGLGAGSRLRRAVHVYPCVRCQRSICRRCVTRVAGRVYCPRCARVLDGLDRSAQSLLLLRRILGKDLEGIERIRGFAAYAAPGLGAIAQGATGSGVLLLLIFCAGTVFGAGLGPDMLETPSCAPLLGVLRAAGWILAAIAWAFSAAVVHSRLGRRSVRVFFGQRTGDDRLAA